MNVTGLNSGGAPWQLFLEVSLPISAAIGAMVWFWYRHSGRRNQGRKGTFFSGFPVQKKIYTNV